MSASRKNSLRGEETVYSQSPEETEQIGVNLVRRISVPAVILLRGELGAGKTTLTRGLAKGMGLKDSSLVHSPSFTLVNMYQGDCPIYHVDLYRLRSERDLYSIGIDDFLGKEGITVIEWSERLPYKVEQTMEIEITDAGEDRRILHVIRSERARATRK